MKKILWSLIVLAVITGALVLVMLFRNDVTEVAIPVAVPAVISDTTSEVEITTGTTTLQTLLDLGQNLECSILYTENAGVAANVTEGTYFTSQGRMRGDFVVPGMIAGAVSSMILVDGILYSWTEIEGEKYGMKITLEDLAKSKTTSGAPEANEVISLDVAVSYTCKPWVALDGSIFEVPADVLFKDYKDLIQVGMEYSTSYEEGDRGVVGCSACEQLTGTEKTQCRTTLSCE